MAEDGGTCGLLGALASKVEFKVFLLKDVMAEYMEIKHVITGLTEEKEKLRHEKEMLRHLQNTNGEALSAMKEDILASKNTLAKARDALMASTEEISQKNNYLEFLKKKLKAKTQQAEQQCASASEPTQPRGVQTRSMQKRKRQFEGPLGYVADENECTSQLDGRSVSHLETMGNLNLVPPRSVDNQKRPSERNEADNLEITEELMRKVDNPTVGQISGVLLREDDDLMAVRKELIKGFLEIDTGGRKIGIKEMGELNERAFKAACLAKVPPEEVGMASHQLYSSWQQQLGDLSWYPFKTILVDGKHQDIVDADDDKLQELKRAWGEGPHNAVVNALLEMKEYDRLSDRSTAYEVWNYNDGRKATTMECVEYMCNQVKQLSVVQRRKARRS